jgi:hypothetical protein
VEEMSAATQAKLHDARKRPAKPGTVRVVVTISTETHTRLEDLAKEESATFPRPVNEMLSILIEKNSEKLFA